MLFNTPIMLRSQCPTWRVAIENGQIHENGMAFDVNLYNSTSVSVEGMNIQVQMSPTSSIIVEESLSLASFDSGLSNNGVALTYSGGLFKIEYYDPPNPITLDEYVLNHLRLFQIFFSGNPGSTYDADIIFTKLLINGTLCGGTSTDDNFTLGSANIGGNIQKKPTAPTCTGTQNGGINDVEVDMTDVVYKAPDPFATANTNTAGNYVDAVVPNGDYTISPNKEGNWTCGLCADDFIYLRKRILRLENYVEPWQIIAADVNNSGQVSTLDMVYMRQVLLGFRTPQSTYHSNWVFIPVNQYLNFPTNISGSTVPTYSTFIQLNDLTQNSQLNDFYGIKVGDPTGSCTECDGSSPPCSPNIVQSVNYEIPNQSWSNGESLTVPIQTPIAFGSWYFQTAFSVDSDYFRITGATMENTATDEFLVKLSEDSTSIIISWMDSALAITNFAKNTTIFSIDLEAGPSGNDLDGKFFIDTAANNILISGADTIIGLSIDTFYTTSGLSRPTNFQSSVVQSEGVIFDQNTGTITFELEESGRVELSVFDIQGRTVWSGSLNGIEGTNAIYGITIPRPSLGIYFYRLNGADHTQAGKLLITH